MIRILKKYINTGIVIILGLLFISTYYLYQINIDLKNKLSISKSNEKAFIVENSGLKDQNRVFLFTVEQLKYLNDSLLIKINNVKKEVNIRDRQLKQLQYLLSEAQKQDTVIFRDTLFIDPTLHIDTLLWDKWYQLRLGLKYPSTVITEPKFISEKYIIMNYKKETINPPKKFFILRWLQKKHKVIEVEVIEKNPYIKNKQQRFIEIIK